MASFSRRNRYAGVAKVISIREDAPEGLRVAVLETARYLRMNTIRLRNKIVCQTLRVRSEPQQEWSDLRDVQELMHRCKWFKVYDIIEAGTRTFCGERRYPFRRRYQRLFYSRRASAGSL